MNHPHLRGALAALSVAALLGGTPTPAAFAEAEAVLPPFVYWDTPAQALPDGQGGSGMSLWGWVLPTGPWREQFPSPGVLHEQIRYVDSDRSRTITRGDEVEAIGPGPGVWRVEMVTTELEFEPVPEAEGLPALLVTADKYYWGCADYIPRACRYETPPCGPRAPSVGDSFFVLSPAFNQIVTVTEWQTNDFVFCNVKVGEGARLAGPPIPPDALPGANYRLKEFRPGVWLSWDPSTDARRTSWGRLKGTYHR